MGQSGSLLLPFNSVTMAHNLFSLFPKSHLASRHRQTKMSRIITNFSRAEYCRLLDEFRSAGYRCTDFQTASELTRHDDPDLILRHDIDFCVNSARKMAAIEAEKGMFSTYFFMLRTPFYNLFTAENSLAVREIISGGHRIGLHFDRMPYPNATVADLAHALNREAAILADWFETKVNIVSYHRPLAREVEGHAEGSHPLLNTYMEAFTKRIKYFSDSQGAFRFGHPLESEAFLQKRPIQILIHPIWWGDEAKPPLDTLRHFLSTRRIQAEMDTALNCKVLRVDHLAHITDPQ